MGCIEPLIVLPVAALHLSIVARSKGADDFVADAMQFQVFLKECRFLTVGRKTVGKFRAIIRLDTLDGNGESFYKVIHKLCGRIGVVLLKSFHKAPSGILIHGSVLKKLLSDYLTVFEAGGRNKFDIHLDALSRIVHLFIGFWNILWIGWVYGHDALFSKEAVKTCNGTGIAALAKLDPEDDKTGMRVSASHSEDHFYLSVSMLVRVVERASRAIPKGIPGTVITAFPAVDIRSVGFIFDSSFGNAKFFSIFD